MHCGWERDMVKPLWETGWCGSPQNQSRRLLYDPTIPLWGDTQKNGKQGRTRYLYANVHSTLFTVARKGKQTQMSTDFWITYIHTTEYCSTLRWNEVLTHAPTWMSLEGIMLSEICQAYVWLHFRRYLEESNSGTQKVDSTPRGWVRGGEWGVSL